MLKRIGSFFLGLAVLSTAGCATVIDGTSQKIDVATSPSDASCTLSRDGETIGVIDNTPGEVEVDRTKHAILVACSKAGYKMASTDDKSGSDAWVWANFVPGGGVGFIVDLATGAHNKYAPIVEVALSPQDPGAVGATPVADNRQDAVVVPRAPEIAVAPPIAIAAPVAVSRNDAPAPLLPPPVPMAPRRPFGVGVAEAGPSDHGVKVMVVQVGSAAATSGVAVGDLLVSLDGEALSQRGDIRRILTSRQEGAIVAVHLIRNGAPFDLAVQL
jgi:PDZ domain